MVNKVAYSWRLTRGKAVLAKGNLLTADHPQQLVGDAVRSALGDISDTTDLVLVVEARWLSWADVERTAVYRVTGDPALHPGAAVSVAADIYRIADGR